MLLKVKVRLTRPLLGECRSNDNILRFKKNRAGKIDIDPTHWQWAFQQAADSLHLEVDVGALSPEMGIRAPSVVLFNRRYVERKNQRESHGSQLHEAISAGTVLTFEIAILRNPQSTKMPPSEDHVKDILGFVGEFVGISQFGNKFGFGRFEVESIIPL